MGPGSQHQTSNVELECVYRRKEDKVEMFDILHMSHEVYSRSDSFYLKQHSSNDEKRAMRE
jgi:hypothetical protein